ncbi:MAG: hypothetical protein H7X93_04385, partial [Sphingomonadaceae bacterium]|nr:hypothetical protein [Sphingomonadaceae bacterium]
MTAKAGPEVTIGGGEDFAEAYDRLSDSGRYQTEMEPVAIEPPEPPSPPPAWLEWLGDLLGSAGGVFELLMWGAIGAVVLLILYILYRRFSDAFAERRARAAGAAGE